jgi:hypothetical protein
LRIVRDGSSLASRKRLRRSKEGRNVATLLEEGGNIRQRPCEASTATVATGIVLRSGEEWILVRYVTMDDLEAAEKPVAACEWY